MAKHDAVRAYNPSVTVIRLYLLRACYLLLVAGLALTKWPLILFGEASQPLLADVVNALLGALGLRAILGLFAPLRMLPFLFIIPWRHVFDHYFRSPAPWK